MGAAPGQPSVPASDIFLAFIFLLSSITLYIFGRSYFSRFALALDGGHIYFRFREPVAEGRARAVLRFNTRLNHTSQALLRH